MLLPLYTPPSARQATVAAGLSPLLVLLTFTLLVTRVIAADTALAAMLALAVWVVVELHHYQRAMDLYNADFVQRHLAWRTPHTLRQLAHDEQVPPPTRDFVQTYVAAGCVLLRDGQVT